MHRLLKHSSLYICSRQLIVELKLLSYGWIIFDVYYVYRPWRDAAWFPCSASRGDRHGVILKTSFKYVTFSFFAYYIMYRHHQVAERGAALIGSASLKRRCRRSTSGLRTAHWGFAPVRRTVGVNRKNF